MAKQRLTDKTLASSVSVNDIVHIVKTGDTSQNPAGSSYKATISQVVSTFTATSVTALTFNNISYDLTLGLDDGSSFSGDLGILASDIKVTGGTYNSSTGEITFVNNKYIKEKKFITNFPRENLDNPNNIISQDLYFHFE